MKNKSSLKISMAVLVALSWVISACNRSEEKLDQYNWSVVDPAFDSCAHQLEQSYLSDCSDSVLCLMTDSLERLASDVRRGPLEMRQLSARTHYWKSMLAERMRRYDVKAYHLEMALAMGDSAKYPYDNMKFKVSACYPPETYDEYVTAYSTLCEAMGFFNTHREPIYVARIGMHISNLLREARLYSEADTFLKHSEDIYRKFGLTDMVIKSKLNYANILSETNPDSTISILRMLLKDPVAKSDFYFYNTVLRNYYLLTGDSTSLFTAYRQLDSMDGYIPEKAFFRAKIADYYLHDDPCRLDSAAHYLHLSLALLDSVDIEKYKTTIYRTAQEVYEACGEYDLAYEYLNQYAAILEKDLHRSQGLARIEKRDSIILMNKNFDHKRTIQNFKFIVIILSILLLIIIIGLIVYFRMLKQRRALLRTKEEKNHRGRKLEGLAVNIQEKEHVLENLEKRVNEMRNDRTISPANAQSLLAILKSHAMRNEGRETFQEIHQSLNPEFYTRLGKDFPDMTENDMRFAAYIAIGLSNSEISNILMIRYQSVKNYRYRLKQKMNLDKEDNLNEVIRSYVVNQEERDDG